MNLLAIWNRLEAVRELTFEAASRLTDGSGWNGRGQGTVHVETSDNGVLLFHERGLWRPEDTRPIQFTNVFRWTANLSEGCIRLEHLRFGVDRPVYLFDLTPTRENVMVSSEPHVCSEDLYSALIKVEPTLLRLEWTIVGPNKSEEICYEYR